MNGTKIRAFTAADLLMLLGSPAASERSLGALSRLHGVAQANLRVLLLHLTVHLHHLLVPHLQRRRQLAGALASLLASLTSLNALCHFC